jgi:hypothetical protein
MIPLKWVKIPNTILARFDRRVANLVARKFSDGEVAICRQPFLLTVKSKNLGFRQDFGLHGLVHIDIHKTQNFEHFREKIESPAGETCRVY